MKVLAVAASIFLIIGAVAANPDFAGPAAEPGPEVAAGNYTLKLGRRACKASKCYCNHVQGQFCGNQKINSYCTNGHVFECNGNDGHTCDYGVRKSCQQCGKLKC